MAAGALAGHRGQAAQAALDSRCQVSREQARLWVAAFGWVVGPGSAVPAAVEEAVPSEEEPAQEVLELQQGFGE
eukprot:10975324-Alexandrium_andersonii.AAC.1